MNSIFEIVEAGQKGDNKAVEALANMDWFRACISEQLDNVWETYGGKMFEDVWRNMDYDYILTLMSFMIAKQVCTPSEGYDVETRLGSSHADTAVKAYVRKYVRNGAFKGEWNKVFYSYAYETHPSIGNNVAAFKRNLSVYVWFLSNSVNQSDIDKTDDEIIASLDLNAISKRYSKGDEEHPTTFGDVKDAMTNDLESLRAWFRELGDFSYADADYNTQDTFDAFVDADTVSVVSKSFEKMTQLQKECYWRHIVNKVSGLKVAEELGISEASVRRYCNKAEEIIQSDLKALK